MYNKKYLLLGAEGFIWAHMLHRLTSQKAIGTSRSSSGDNCLQFDAVTMNLSDVVADPDEIKHCFILYGDTLPVHVPRTRISPMR